MIETQILIFLLLVHTVKEEANSDVEKKKNVEKLRKIQPFRELHIIDSNRTVAARRNDQHLLMDKEATTYIQ